MLALRMNCKKLNTNKPPKKMKTEKTPVLALNYLSIISLSAVLLVGCQSSPGNNVSQPAPAVASTPPAVSTPAVDSKQLVPPIRIKADSTESFKDSSGNVWLPDQGFADGDTVERPELMITNT